MTRFLSVLSPFKMYALLAVGAAVAITVGWLFYQNVSLKDDLVRSKQDIIQLQANLNSAIAANKENEATIDALQLEKALINESLKSLEEARRRDSQVIGTLSATIRAQAANPANQVPLSPVLKDTVREIQQQRQRRQGEKK